MKQNQILTPPPHAVIAKNSDNRKLHRAKVAKNDEFYTQLADIEKELVHYHQYFKGKTVYCNCDDPFESNFFKYFVLNFNHLGLKKLIATCYDGSPIADTELSLFDFEPKENKTTRQAHKIIITEVTDKNSDGAFDLSDIKILLANKKNALTRLKGNGDFRSIECIELLKQADIVCTNPPFSLFREYIAQLVEYGKKFVVIGNQNAITYKEIFPLIKENKLWLGYQKVKKFMVPEYYEEKMTGFQIDERGQKWRSMGNVCWFTNLEHKKRYEEMILYRNYSPEAYPKYDNYDAIEVSKVSDIPCDYDGVMGVPITFLDKYNRKQFEIVGMGENEDLYKLKTKVYTTAECKQAYQNKFNKKGTYDLNASGVLIINGIQEKVYQRILIRKKK